jgi:hypothetical protein
VLISLAALWAVTIGLGASVMWKYEDTPGRLAAPPAVWPGNVPFHPAKDRDTLLLFVHPECPCSRATLEELARIMVFRHRLEAQVFFFAPKGSPQWRGSGLYDSARHIPGVRALSDPDGFMGRRFGARTSGQALLYDDHGHLLFNGGITGARGHAGDNDGVDAIVALIHGETPATRTTPVFGCSIYGAE